MSKDTITMIIAAGIYPPSIGGPATYAKLLVDRFSSYGYEVEVVAFDSVRRYPKIVSHALYFLRLLRGSVGVDVIYVMDPVSVGLPALMVSLFTRKRYILRLGGDYAWEQGVARFGVKQTLDNFVLERQSVLQVRLLQYIQSLVARNAKMVVVPSEYLKRIVVKWGLPLGKIKVIYNAFDAPVIPPAEVSKKNTISVLSVGRLVAWKGFKELIAVVRELVLEGHAITLEIAGSGPLEKELQEYINDIDAGRYITLLGPLAKEDLYRKMLSSDIFVLYTKYEGFSHLILEAMSLGVPIITTKVGGNVEILHDDVNAILIDRNTKDLKSAIVALSKDALLRDRISEQAKADVSVFTHEKMFRELDKAIRSLV